MCTATSWDTSPEDFVASFRRFEARDVPEYRRLMIRPTEMQVTTLEGHRLELRPFGIADPDPQRQKRRILNARRENLARSPLWRSLMKDHRCVVFVSAFFECRRNGGMKVFRIGEGRGGRLGPSALAGVYDRSGVVIVTRPAEGVMTTIHDRMPAVLMGDWIDEWLGSAPEVARKLVERPPPDLTAFPIATDAFKRDPNDPALLQEDRSSAPEQQLLF